MLHRCAIHIPDHILMPLSQPLKDAENMTLSPDNLYYAPGC